MEKVLFNHRISLEKLNKAVIKNDHQAHSLSPLNNLDQGEEKESYEKYENRLISALNEESVFNIAVTGIYGSGKSSILNTFKKKYKENSQWEFLDISLSSFQISKDTLSDDKDSNAIDEDASNIKIEEKLTPEQIQLIERSILQQFFYAVPQNKIPLSRFKRITGNALTNKVTALLVITLIISGLVVFDKVDYIEDIYSLPTWLPELTLWCFLVCSILLLYKLLNISFELSEIKLNFHNSEFNIKNEKEKSILNDHLDEILYFFEATGKNVVIIEDLDRFNNNEIFVRLRELNSMINKYCEGRVVFLYAIKDDMFTDTERSKFFEYIIPVIPIINPTNAYDLIQKNYKKVVEDIDKRFLRNACLYFDDMRLVKNILNEYQDYDNHLKYLQLDKNQVFAIVVYKNYYPNDFSKLNSNRGLIYNIFNDVKLNLIDKKITQITDDIHELEESKLELSNEMLLSIDELNAIYSYYLNSLIRKKHDVVKYIKVDSETVDIDGYDEDIFLKLESLKNKKIEFNSQNSNSHWFSSSDVSFSDVEDSTNSQLIYSERLAIIRAKTNEGQKEISNNLSKLKDELYAIKNKTLNKLLQDIDIKKLLQDEEIPDIPEQLMFFIINGYINENYPDYISLFFESSISRSDKNYAMVVNGRQMPKFELELTHQGELLSSYLSEDEMSTSSVLNISMLGYLLQTSDFVKHKQNFLYKICDKSDISVEFLAILFNKDVSYLSLLIPVLIKQDNTVFDEILDDIEDEETTNNYSKIIRYGIDILDTSSYLSEKINRFLSKKEDYINFLMDSLSGNKGKFKQLSLSIQPKFSRLDATNLDLFNWLGEQGFFSIELDIIKAALMGNLSLSLDELEDRLKNEPLTTICDSEISYLVKDFWENVNDYVYLLTTYLEDEKQLDESQIILIKLLNKEDLSEDNKERLLLVVATEVTDIDHVQESLHEKLFKYNVVSPTWENINKNFISNEYKLSEHLIDFINKNAVVLTEDRTAYIEATSSDNETQKSLEIELVKSNDIEDIHYQKILKILVFTWNRIDFTELNESKVLSLITCKKLNLTKENLDCIKTYDVSNVRDAFIEHNISSFIEGELADELELVDYITILYSSKLNKAQKQDFVEKNISMMMEVANISPNEIVDVFDDKRLPSELYEKIKDTGKEDHIQYLFLGQVKFLSSTEILSLLPSMGQPFSELNKDSKTKFDINQKNKTLLDALYARKIVVIVTEVKKALRTKFYETRLQKTISR